MQNTIHNTMYLYTHTHTPVVLKISTLLSYSAIQLVDKVDNNGVCQCGNQPEVIGTVSCKKTTLKK